MACSGGITKRSLCLDIDISKYSSYNLNSEHNVISTVSSCNTVSSKFDLPDYGLTQYDIGRTTSLTGSSSITYTNNKLSLSPIAYNDASGNTTVLGSITLTTGSTGNYFMLSGGSYLQNFFKLKDYDYQLLPYRYANGFTFDMMLNITNNTFSSITNSNDGIFLFLGTRAENKFSYKWTGDTGYTTSLNHNLGSDFTEVITCPTGNSSNIDKYIIPTSALTMDTGNTTCTKIDFEKNISGDSIAFKFNGDGGLSIRQINFNNDIVECTSPNQLTITGWTNFQITFNPYEELPLNLIDCYPVRQGDLVINVNGSQFWKIPNFNELWFMDLAIDKERQIGVPYTISWGGGSFGLKHSYHFKLLHDTISGDTFITNYPYEQDPLAQNLMIQENFDGSFTGGIQTLRIYCSALNKQELYNNALYQSGIYGYKFTAGSRIITSY